MWGGHSCPPPRLSELLWAVPRLESKRLGFPRVAHFSRTLREVGSGALYGRAQSCQASPFTRENSDTLAVTSVN